MAEDEEKRHAHQNKKRKTGNQAEQMNNGSNSLYKINFSKNKKKSYKGENEKREDDWRNGEAEA